MKCPINHDHEVKEVQMAYSSYEFCTVCKEDVEYLARQQNPGAPVTETEDDTGLDLADDEDDFEDDDMDMDDDMDGDDDAYVAAPPANWNPRPVRNMGNAAGTHQVVLLNNPNTGAHLVTQILQEVFQKDHMESQFVMMDCHYSGRAACFYANQAEAQEMLARIEAKKQELTQRGAYAANTLTDLQFVVEARNAN